MIPNKMRVAIAKECGISVEPCTCAEYPWRDAKTKKHIPDYPKDLNACHDMEKVLTSLEREQYVHHLFKSAGTPEPLHYLALAHFVIVHATALQRCEAFCRVKGIYHD